MKRIESRQFEAFYMIQKSSRNPIVIGTITEPKYNNILISALIYHKTFSFPCKG